MSLFNKGLYILFNIFINDLFFFIQEANICNFADDNTLYASGFNILDVVSTLSSETANILEWFKVNSMVANPEKFQIMFLGIPENEINTFQIGDIQVATSQMVKLLGVLIDSKLTFKQHVKSLCAKASQKTKALFRIRNFLDVLSAKRLCSAFILSNFKYCPLIWMSGCKSNDELINKVHLRALRVVYINTGSTLSELLEIDGSDSIHV